MCVRVLGVCSQVTVKFTSLQIGGGGAEAELDGDCSVLTGKVEYPWTIMEAS